MEFEFLIEKNTRRVSVEKKEKGWVFREGDSFFEADIRPISENAVSVLLEGRSYVAWIVRNKGEKWIFLEGRQYLVQEPGGGASFQEREEKAHEGPLRIKAPMPGKVIKVDVTEGDEVRKNQTLAIVEAMKMENEIKSSIEAVVKNVYVKAGDLVDSEKPLIELEPKKGGSP
jgi:biotin carboxyl carrier protein